MLQFYALLKAKVPRYLPGLASKNNNSNKLGFPNQATFGV